MNRFSMYFLCFVLSIFVALSKSEPQVSSQVSTGEISEQESGLPAVYALSATYLIYLANLEAKIYEEMVKYSNAMEERMKLIRSYMKDYEESSLNGVKSVLENPDNPDPWEAAVRAAEHPLIAYRITRRFAYEFQAIMANIGQELEYKIEHKVNKLAGEYGLPTVQDNEDAIEALLRLHYMYDLKLEEFANGKIGKTNTNIGLSTEQGFEVAKYATDNEYFTLAKDWLDLTQARIEQAKNSSSSTVDPAFVAEVQAAVEKNIEEHDEKFDSYPEEEFYMFTGRLKNTSNADGTTPTRVRENLLASTLEEVNEPEGTGLKWYLKQTNKLTREHYTFMGLCNGDNYQTEEVKKELNCWYDSTRSAFFGPINPLKMELLNKDPMLLQIYDVIGDDWIEKLVHAAMPTLERAPYSDAPGVTFRTASYAWLSDEEIPEVPISRRIELITGLNVRGRIASEDLQIASYAYGGHVAMHSDSLGEASNAAKIAVMGNRVTTFLIYLNEVIQGGYTAFPTLKTHVKPVRGSAVLWYTALKNGDVDSRMLHGACPVILGHKWIATKWTNLHQNFLKRPCGLDRND